MIRGIRLAILATLVGGTSCRQAPDPRQLATLDSTLTAVEAASLTLNELGPHHYLAADSILNATRPLFLVRFEDTLDRPTAELLGDQYVQLRQASLLLAEQDRVRTEVERTMVRLQALRSDMVQGAIGTDAAQQAVAEEVAAFGILNDEVLRTLENHKTTQRAVLRQAEVDRLLATTDTTDR